LLAAEKEQALPSKQKPPQAQKQARGQHAKMKGTFNRRKDRKGMCLEDRPVLEPNAGGIDVGARESANKRKYQQIKRE